MSRIRRSAVWFLLCRRRWRLALCVLFMPSGWALLRDERTHITDRVTDVA